MLQKQSIVFNGINDAKNFNLTNLQSLILVSVFMLLKMSALAFLFLPKFPSKYLPSQSPRCLIYSAQISKKFTILKTWLLTPSAVSLPNSHSQFK